MIPYVNLVVLTIVVDYRRVLYKCVGAMSNEKRSPFSHIYISRIILVNKHGGEGLYRSYSIAF